ncbi:MAG: endonuclease Q family protein [Methanomicrobiales archaeon]
MHINADLHIHSPHSIATSAAMTPERIIAACITKGLGAVGTGDALHPGWRDAWRAEVDDAESAVVIVPSAEVEDRDRIHHLILMESMEAFADLGDRLVRWCTSLGDRGRPHLSCAGEEIARAVHDHGGLIGPAHAFTPWTSLYRNHDHLADCYGTERPDFLELGLSADSSFGASISDLDGIPFLSNSDAHGPATHRLGREFTRLEVSRPDAESVLEAVRRGAILQNAGLFPELGKYYSTACSRCFRQCSLEEAGRLAGRCPHDGGRIKKGVRDRARELADRAPAPRPPYHHLIPLGEIIQAIEGMSSPETRTCARRYRTLVTALGPEIDILLDLPVETILEADPVVGEAITAIRAGDVPIRPGGGGRYGTVEITGAGGGRQRR